MPIRTRLWCVAMLLASFFAIFVAGCSSVTSLKGAVDGQDAVSGRDIRVARVLAKAGLNKLSEHRYEDASRIFNAGLKFAPTDARLHFLNGMAYHLLYLRGDEPMKDLGVAGYELALKYDPAFYLAALQLGRLQFEAKRYAESAAAFQRAIDIQPKSGIAYLGLASADYYTHDLGAARSAVDKASALLPKNADAARASALIHAALYDRTTTGEALARYAVLEQNPNMRAKLGARVDQWISWNQANPGTWKASGSAKKDVLLAKGYASTGASTAGAQKSQTPTAPQKPWFDCGGANSDQGQSSYGSNYGGSDSDDLAPMPRLPRPCAGAGKPRMVILDVVFVRTEDNASSSHGVNLLQGLGYIFNFGRTTDNSGTLTLTRSWAVSSTDPSTTPSLGAGIQYSLNIANAAYSRDEILARPSLLALDGEPSNFFSGRQVTLGIPGFSGGVSTLTDRPIGVSLSVTPTFIDDETLLLAIRAQRSFVEALDANVNVNQSGGVSFQTSRNMVSTNVVLKMGQTLVLSGLSEQEIQRGSNGVPLLKDIPGLQYLFSTQALLNYTRSMLILITPRRPESDYELTRRTLAHVATLNDPAERKFRSLIAQELKKNRLSVPSNLDRTYGHVYGNMLFLQFRTGDLDLNHWSEKPRLTRFFRQLSDMLYF